MSNAIIILIYIGLTLLIIGICYLLGMYNMRGKAGPRRYKLGERWDSGPLWFVGRPKAGTSAHTGYRALTPGSVDQSAPTVVGGASGTW